ncbi:hypothetical protein [Halosimplex pelagicum]|uniref:Uncharacterized protein n=1 Tax=Halosimplex pelagicum TaxID=869886 RepID=A0A7D5P4A9_9EURY|nr:hypothetical protein [Halosimplex pelagicum]QLH80417.1 hypothetical protein HZS54_01685 [Halosimplex pelagicum]
MPSNSTADRGVRTTASDDAPIEGDGDDSDGGADPSVRRATRVMRLLKLAATTLAALAGAAKALGLV